jgi:hypothetical protein
LPDTTNQKYRLEIIKENDDFNQTGGKLDIVENVSTGE